MAKPSKSKVPNKEQGFLEASSLYNTLRFRVVPPLFLLLFTGAVQILVLLGRGETPCPFDFEQCHRVHGNAFSWKFVGFCILWAMASLWVPSKKFVGPATPDGFRPTYVDNGFAYFLVTCLAFAAAQVAYPGLSDEIYENMPEILGCLNSVALALCTWLLVKGRLLTQGAQGKNQGARMPLLYDFYRGCELHPRLLGCDLKQLTNCRVGLMLWQVLAAAFLAARWGRAEGGGAAGALVSAALQTLYLAKFFWWETGYFNTLDITYDRAGYYLCWGCLVWVPALYAFPAYHQVAFPSALSPAAALLTFLLGLAALLLNYRVDYEKQVFSSWWNGDRKKAAPRVWGREARWVEAAYVDAQGVAKRSALLTCGWWGLLRKGNYTFELLFTFAWSAPAAAGHPWLLPLLYPLFLLALLVHRCFRDEDKCQAKYGAKWDEYCRRVPYRLVPFLF